MQEVRIAAESIGVTANLVLHVSMLVEVRLPLLRVVGALDTLQFAEQNLVLIDNSRQTPDAVGTIQRCVRVERGGCWPTEVLPARLRLGGCRP